MNNLIVLVDILKEQERQIKKWNIRDHDPLFWLAILVEEVGELAKAILISQSVDSEKNGGPEEVREEAIHVAAVAVTFIECLDQEEMKEK